MSNKGVSVQGKDVALTAPIESYWLSSKKHISAREYKGKYHTHHRPSLEMELGPLPNPY